MILYLDAHLCWLRRIADLRHLAIRAVGIVAAVFALGLPEDVHARDAGAIQTGVYRGPGCDGLAQLPAFEGFIGREVDRVVDFLDLRSWKIMRESAAWTFGCWKDQPFELTISVPMLPKDGTSTLEAGATGAYDATFREIARLAVDSGRADIIVRLGWEFNGDWYPWSSQRAPAMFIAYWRRIVAVMRSVPGQNFRFEWCFSLADRLGDPSVAYPGDDVVDIVSADVYNQTWKWGLSDPGRRWAFMLDSTYGLKWDRSFALAHGKEIAFPEWGTGTRPDGHGWGDDPVFINGMADWIETVRPVYHAYWDYPAPDFDAELSGGRQPKSASAFKTRFGSKPSASP